MARPPRATGRWGATSGAFRVLVLPTRSAAGRGWARVLRDRGRAAAEHGEWGSGPSGRVRGPGDYGRAAAPPEGRGRAGGKTPRPGQPSLTGARPASRRLTVGGVWTSAVPCENTLGFCGYESDPSRLSPTAQRHKCLKAEG
ncbi:hypothetical protein NN561_017626 [Cricetulus griseus]